MTNSPLEGLSDSLWSEALSCHLRFSLLINLQPWDKAQRGSCKEWAPQGKLSSLQSNCTAVTSALRHFHLAFPAHPGNKGLWSQHTLTLYGSPTGNTSLWETHWKWWVQKPNSLVLWWRIFLPSLGSDCVLQPELVWEAKLKFSLVIPGPELSDWWASAFVHLTHLFCHLKITPDIAAGPFWEAEKSLALLSSISQCGISLG